MIETILHLLSQERTAFLELARRLRNQRTSFAGSRGADMQELTRELAALEAPRAAAAHELATALQALAPRAEAAGPGRISLRQVLGRLPPRDRARLIDAATATRAAAEKAHLELAVGERLLGFATEIQGAFLRDLLDAVGPRNDMSAVVDVKG